MENNPSKGFKKLLKKTQSAFIVSLIITILFVAGIPMIICFAGKVTILMILGIIFTGGGFYAMPLMWIAYGNKVRYFKVLVAIENKNIYTVSELSSILNRPAKEIVADVKKLLSDFYLEGYTFDGTMLIPVNRPKKTADKISSNKCPNCGANLIDTDNKVYCQYCGFNKSK